ncbi:hypothetical protein SFRURICE_021401, partial [Spodoptera frugiperda]
SCFASFIVRIAVSTVPARDGHLFIQLTLDIAASFKFSYLASDIEASPIRCPFKNGAARFDLGKSDSYVQVVVGNGSGWLTGVSSARATDTRQVKCSVVQCLVIDDGGAGMPSVMLSAVLEEEPDLYEAFPPHVDPTGITILTDSP